MAAGQPHIGRQPFGAMPDGTEVERFTLNGAGGARVQVLTYGGIIQTLRVPDRAGRWANVVLGYDDLDGYLRGRHYFGALIGRYANRIAGGRFSLDGAEYRLARNDPPNHLHGGEAGFDKLLWAASPSCQGDEVALVLELTSPAGQEGYPGTLSAQVTYTLSAADELRVDFEATSDEPTVVNLTGHSYFNLAGEGAGDVLGHELWLDADSYTPIDPGGIPTGELAPVAGTPFDFGAPGRLGDHLRASHPQLELAGGFDHNLLVRDWDASLRPVARLADPASGRTLVMSTTEPGLQVYTGNKLDASVVGTGGRPYGPHHGLAIEPQHFPDSPNRPDFPTTVLAPGRTYRSTSVLAFSA